MEDTFIKQLRSTRPGYEDECVWHKFLIDSYTGGGGFRGKVQQPASGYWGWAAAQYRSRIPMGGDDGQRTYLDRHPRETVEKFDSRINVSHYLNYVEPLTSLKTSYMLRRAPSEVVPPALSEWQHDVDGSGNSYRRFERRLADRVAVIGWIPVLTEMPQHNATTAAQARELGVRTSPVVRSLLPMHLLDYQLDESGAFVWAKICTQHEARDGDSWDGKALTLEKFRIWTRKDVTTYVVRKRDGEKPEIVERLVEGHEYGAVPIDIAKHSETEEDPVKSVPMHGDVAIEARRLFNLLSEFDEHIRAQLFAVLVHAGAPSAADGGELNIGPDQGLFLASDSRQKHYYLSPDPGLAEVFERRIERTVQEIYRIARAEYERNSGANSSAASRRSEFEKTNAAIASFAEQMADFKRRLLTRVGGMMGVPTEGIKVTAANRFDIGDPSSDMDAVLGALDLEAGPTARKRLLLHAVTSVLPNLDPDTRQAIEKEIGASVDDLETEEDQRLDAQESAMLSDSAGDETDRDGE